MKLMTKLATLFVATSLAMTAQAATPVKAKPAKATTTKAKKATKVKATNSMSKEVNPDIPADLKLNETRNMGKPVSTAPMADATAPAATTGVVVPVTTMSQTAPSTSTTTVTPVSDTVNQVTTTTTTPVQIDTVPVVVPVQQ